MSVTQCVLFAGGGTGGHVFPLVAVADALRELAPEVTTVFVGTPRGIETRVVPERGYELELMRVEPIRGGGVAGIARGVWRAAASVPDGLAVLRRRAPRAVLSIGGYAAGPISLAARLSGVPVALIEPNAAIGLANQLVAPWVERGYTAFSGPERWFRRSRVLRTGVPIRGGFEPRPYRREPGMLRVLVLGGSQGARTLNEVVPRALARAEAAVRVLHQCGRGHDGVVRRLYGELGAGERVDVVSFIEDMPGAIGAADLVISRAGASAISEICAVGRASILVPYPFAAADHQHHNARSLEQDGAAITIANADATPQRVSAEIDRLVREERAIEQMAEAARKLGRPGAARAIALDLMAIAGVEQPENVPGGTAGRARPRDEPPATMAGLVEVCRCSAAG